MEEIKYIIVKDWEIDEYVKLTEEGWIVQDLEDIKLDDNGNALIKLVKYNSPNI